jgi:hypothetical protein
MRYVVAGYVIVLTTLFLYGLQLVWRRRRLDRAVARVVRAPAGAPGPASVTAAGEPAPDLSGADR